jgi:ribosome biogenesis GTPase
MKGKLVKAISGFYYVEAENKLYECKARGVLRKQLSPVVGDNVEITVSGTDIGVIEAVLPRKNCLIRPQIANIDKLFIVSSYNTPAPNTLLIDRITAIAEYYGIQPVIVFNKSDLGDFSQFVSIYKNAGFNTYTVSAKIGEGIDDLKKELSNCISAFTGNSGVGKSSLLNVLFSELDLKTGEVSEKLGRGRHTTRHNELFKHALGGYVADTPGFSSLDSLHMGFDFKENLADCFSDFVPFLTGCKFTSCSHIKEKGCLICDAVENGKIEKSRHESYVSIYHELKSINSWDKK